MESGKSVVTALDLGTSPTVCGYCKQVGSVSQVLIMFTSSSYTTLYSGPRPGEPHSPGLQGAAGPGLEEEWSVRVQAGDGGDVLSSLHHQVPGRQVHPHQVPEEGHQES